MPIARRQTSNSNQRSAIPLRFATGTIVGYQPFIIALLLATFAVRLHALLQLPGFVDEGNHLLWANEIWQGHVVFPFSTAKALEMYFLAALVPFRAPLWVGRFGSVLTGAVTLSALYALARAFGKPRAGLFAAAFYALLPWTFFHERLAVADPLTAAIAILLAWIAIQWSKRPSFSRASALTLSLLCLPLAKLSAAPLAILPILTTWLKNKSALRRLWLPYSAAIVIAASILLLVNLRYSVGGELSGRNVIGRQGSEWILANSRDAMQWSRHYLGWAGALIVIGAVAAVFRRTALSIVALAGFLIASGTFIFAPSTAFPRYYLPALAFGSLLAGEAVATVARSLSLRWRPLTGVVFVAALGLPFAAFVMQAYTHPEALDLTEIDRQQHVTSWSSGYGIRDAVAYTADLASRESQPAVVYTSDLATLVIAKLYWPPDASGRVYEIWDANAPDVIATVPAGTPTYLIADTGFPPVVFAGVNIVARELARFPRPSGGSEVVVYRLVAIR